MTRTWLIAAAHGWTGSKAFLRSRQGNTGLTDLAGRLPGDDTQLPRPGVVPYAWRSWTVLNEEGLERTQETRVFTADDDRIYL